MKTKRRFSKQVVIDQLDKQIDHFQKQHGFHHRTGWAQVDKKGEAVNRAYGQWRYCADLKNWIINGELE